MAATITGSGPSGTFLVTDQASGVTAPATLDQLSLHPDLYAQAVSLSTPQAAVGGGPIDAAAAGIGSLGGAAADGMGKLAQYVHDKDPLGYRGAAPADAQTVPAPPGGIEPPPIGGTPAATPVTPPGHTPPPGGPAGAAPIPTAPRGTGGRAPRTPAGPDIIDQATGQKLAGEAQGEANERAVYDKEATDRHAMMQAEATRQAEYKRNADAAYRQQLDAQKSALAAHNLDPDKFWQDKGAIGAILFAISAGARGAAGGWNGHPEAGSQFVDDAIKQNLEIQQKRAEALDRNAEAKGNLVQHFRQQGLDDASAFQAALAAQKEMVATDLKRAAIKLNNQGLSPQFLKTAGDLEIQSQKDHVDLAKSRAETVLARTGAGKNVAETGKINAETAKLGQNTNADAIAKQMAAAGKPIPKALALLTSPELQKNITGDGQLLTGEASEVNKVTANSAGHLATLKNALRIVNDPKASPESKTQAAQDAYASAKVYLGLKRGGGEDEQAMASMAPGLHEALGSTVKWASPGSSKRAAEALQNEIVNVQRRTSAEGQAYGRAPTPGANIDFSRGLQ